MRRETGHSKNPKFRSGNVDFCLSQKKFRGGNVDFADLKRFANEVK